MENQSNKNPEMHLSKAQEALENIVKGVWAPYPEYRASSIIVYSKKAVDCASSLGTEFKLPECILTKLTMVAKRRAETGNMDGWCGVSEILEVMKQYATLAKLPVSEEAIKEIKQTTDKNKYRSELYCAAMCQYPESQSQMEKHLKNAKMLAAQVGVNVDKEAKKIRENFLSSPYVIDFAH